MTGCLATLKPTFMKVRILEMPYTVGCSLQVGDVVDARPDDLIPGSGYKVPCFIGSTRMEIYMPNEYVEVIKEPSHIPYIKIGSVSVMSAVGFMAFGLSVGLNDLVVLLTGLAFAVTNFCVLSSLIPDEK